MIRQKNKHKMRFVIETNKCRRQPIYASILLFIFVIAASNSHAQFTESKEINKHFKIAKDTKVEISNKYGNIEIET